MKLVRTNCPILKIVKNGAVSSPDLGEGRMIPCLIIDIEDNVAIAELIKLHKKALPGDAWFQWAKPLTLFKSKTKILSIEFSKPMKFEFGIEFDLSNDYSAIDGIIQSKGLHLFSGKQGDKVLEKFGSGEGIILEVPDLNIGKDWDKELFGILKDKYKKQGAAKMEAINLAKQQIKKMREFWGIRRPA